MSDLMTWAYWTFMALMVLGATAWAVSEIQTALQRWPRRQRPTLAPLMRDEYQGKGRRS